ncbi:damage-specific DNA binding protein 2-like protein [Leptotrombidium deliense]|uniref:DNA damage-binding protein 2 n=1 Tax=Leptotrombidium deliense TaxID=299467 RepID=A0A443S7Q1_9ACAR|nr:damage-specific DNA binding protein 2-like protein [Leptotrombidium deliense]
MARYYKSKHQRRFASLDVNCDKKMLMAGDNCGYIHLLSTGRDNVTKVANVSQSVHNGHILHCEFNPVQPHIIVTSSVDRLVKIWDLRMISRNPKPVFKHEFKFPLNAATFNPSNGATLVVADNREQIAIFRGPTWEKELVVRHAHHQYQMNSLLKV